MRLVKQKIWSDCPWEIKKKSRFLSTFVACQGRTNNELNQCREHKDSAFSDNVSKFYETLRLIRNAEYIIEYISLKEFS